MTDYDGPGSNNDTTYRYHAAGRRVEKTDHAGRRMKVLHGNYACASYLSGPARSKRAGKTRLLLTDSLRNHQRRIPIS
jgi:YD repeat-containing protein